MLPCKTHRRRHVHDNLKCCRHEPVRWQKHKTAKNKAGLIKRHFDESARHSTQDTWSSAGAALVLIREWRNWDAAQDRESAIRARTDASRPRSMLRGNT